MKHADRSWQTLAPLLLACCSFIFSSTVFAGDGIRVHRANEFNRSEAPSEQEYKQHLWRLHKQHSQRQRSRAQNVPVPDSRFPNSYQDYSYYQRQQQQHRRR